MATFREGDYATHQAAVDVEPYQVVTVNSDDEVVLASASDIRGVVDRGAKAGDSTSYALINGSGSFKVRLGGTVAKGDALTSNSNGFAVKASAGNVVFGTALAAGGEGDVVEYLKRDTVAPSAG